MSRRPPRSTPFPYTTLFRSMNRAETFVPVVFGFVTIKSCVANSNKFGHLLNRAPFPDLAKPKEGFITVIGLAWKLRFGGRRRSEEHTSELQSRLHLVCRLLL